MRRIKTEKTIPTQALVLIVGLSAIVLAVRALAIRATEPSLAPQAAAQLAETFDRDLVLIPAGDFVMGSDIGRDDERPQHGVTLDAFEMDRVEVTNVQYRRFLLATGRGAPRYWIGGAYPPGQADVPVVGVSWDDADAYCTWAGKRLPTEAEWEKACRGAGGRVYPWGDEWNPDLANVYTGQPSLVGIRGASPDLWNLTWQLLGTARTGSQPGLQPVGSHREGRSVYGVMDMVGNASEWVADWYNWSDYSGLPTRNPRLLGPPWNHSLRGSPWFDPVGTPDWVKAMSRCSARSSSHEVADPRVGFRCALGKPAAYHE